ncbi:MAG: hypothetical protein V2J26_01800 [Pacificimonas sp.]|jgi:hypothetical protein|nr:hypothetical protein [Pacificimonas sp.]
MSYRPARLLVLLLTALLIGGCAGEPRNSFPSLAVRPGESAPCSPERLAESGTAEIGAAGEASPALEAEPAAVPGAELPDIEDLRARFEMVLDEWTSAAARYEAASGERALQLWLGRVEAVFLRAAAIEAEIAPARARYESADTFAAAAPDHAALWERIGTLRERHTALLGVDGREAVAVSDAATFCGLRTLVPA